MHLLSSLVDPLVSEKRMQFRARLGIEIECRLDEASYGLFAAVQPAEFKRVVSNLIDNGVEALQDKGSVTVSLRREGGAVLLVVRDSGKGIAPEIISKLGLRGETHGKEGGSGLGLHHAKTTVESWGGNLEIESALDKGTTITVKLPEARPPDWFVSSLQIAAGGTVVVFDDDPNIHRIWQGRFDSLNVKGRGTEVFHFSTPAELRRFVSERQAQAREALYLPKEAP